MRTPWLLGTSDNSSAYVGIGYSVNRHREQGKVVLGCSIYTMHKGRGLNINFPKLKTLNGMLNKKILIYLTMMLLNLDYQ
jgi:hypothetical protein